MTDNDQKVDAETPDPDFIAAAGEIIQRYPDTLAYLASHSTVTDAR